MRRRLLVVLSIPEEEFMQHVHATVAELGKVTCFVPRWIPEGLSVSGMPYKVFPLVSSLVRHGLSVDFFTEVADGGNDEGLRQSLRGSVAAVAWCAEMNPGVQVPGMARFLELARDSAPQALRLAGGGFFYLLPESSRHFGDLAHEMLFDAGIPSVAERVLMHLGREIPRDAPGERIRKGLDPYALSQIDLTPFVRPEGMIFGNDEPTLQVPTALGCPKRCSFCFYERTQLRVMPANDMVEMIASLVERHGVRQYLLGELDFLAGKRRALEFARGLLERELSIRWFALVSMSDLERLSDEEVGSLAKSGAHALEIGTEVGSANALRKIGKSYSMSEVLPQTKRLLRHGIVPVHNIMFGFPGETARDRRATLRLVRRLHALGPGVRFNFRTYQAVPNTTLGERALEPLGPPPASVLELANHRGSLESGRALPWLSERAERSVRELTEHYLPLAYDDALLVDRPNAWRRVLQTLARWRCRFGYVGHPVDRLWFERTQRVGLATTFLP